jgi:hypothetical protein
MYVIKASGKKEEFDSGKIYRTVMRAGASRALASEIVGEVESKVYEGMRTRDILDMTLALLRGKKPNVSMVYDLKRAIMSLGPTGFVFEKYFAEILNNYGYRTQTGQMLNGTFAAHEVDIIAKKKGNYMIECKYHNSPGVYTNLKTALYVYARFLDLKKSFDFPWLATNTKCSDKAIRYAKGVGMKVTSWQYPGKESLQDLIEGKKLYPVTILRSVNEFVKWRLCGANILVASDLVKKDFQELRGKIRIPDEMLRRIIEEARQVYSVRTGK